MSVMGRNPRTVASAPARGARAPRAPEGAGASLSVSWFFDAALVGGAPSHGADAPPAELRCEVAGGLASAALHVPGAPVRVLAERVAATVTTDRASGYEHVDAPGVLSLTRAGQRLLCARTPLLAALGVPGGRAERPGISTAS